MDHFLKFNLKLFLFQKIAGWIHPTPGHDNNTAGAFAPELLDQIIDHLHDDRSTLLRLGLTCRQSLLRSRLHLFSELEFIQHFNSTLDKKDRSREFDRFLSLLEAPWTSFSNVVESLHVKNLFWRSRDYKRIPIKDLPRILANLPNLKTLRLTSIPWSCIPSEIRDFFLQASIVDLQIYSVEFTPYRPGKIDLVELFVGLQPSIKSITLYDLQHWAESMLNLSQYSSTFLRRIHLTKLDTCSLLFFKDVWDPLHANDLQLDITIESFHVRLIPMSESEIVAYVPFFSRFLRHVGPSTIHHIFIKFTDPYLEKHILPYYVLVDLSQCVNVRIVHVGTIQLDHISHSGERASPTMAAVWNSLSTLPYHSRSLEEVVFIFRPSGEIVEEQAAELESFAWLDFVGRLQGMFPSLKTITVGVGIYMRDKEDFAPYLAALHRVPGLRQLEEKGTVSLQKIPWQDFGSPDPAWK